MCGIVGIHGPQDESCIEAMNSIQHHRGPDGGGVFRDRDARLTLAMRRLAILDLAGGNQPMTSEDGRYVLVYNGEIYNSPDLRRGLEAAGVAFHTDHSDTEVLLHLLIRDGEAALPRLNGMFAFAFYDRAKGTLQCARDRMGIKPLYYTSQGGRFAFASELKSLLTLPWVERQADRQSLFHYLSLMYVPGERTAIEGVLRLPPGHMLRLDLATGELKTSCWWQPSFRPDTTMAAKEWPDRILAALDGAVGRWSLADVPVGCSLSGGLDSSAIVGLLAQRGAKIRTYSLGFAGPGEADWSELPLARQVAEKWGTQHHEIVLDPTILLDDLVAMVWHLDEPYGGGLPSWSVFQAMSRDVKVGMTGTGGDELFGNYGKWRSLEGGFLARTLGRRADGADAFRREFFNRFYYFTDEAKRAMLAHSDGLEDTADLLYRHYSAAQNAPIRDRAAVTDIGTQLAEEFLMMTDRFSMAHCMEARTPFLDNELVDVALSIPAEIRTHRRDLKGLLRKAVAPVLPPSLLTAPKKGFVIPLKLWLRGPLRPLCERLFAPQRLAAQGLFNPDFHAAFVMPHMEGRADHTAKVWGALMLQLWYALHIEGASYGERLPSIEELAAT